MIINLILVLVISKEDYYDSTKADMVKELMKNGGMPDEKSASIQAEKLLTVMMEGNGKANVVAQKRASSNNQTKGQKGQPKRGGNKGKGNTGRRKHK